MSFLSPWFLLAGLAVGVPFWLHLVRREQPVRIPFSSLMFFRRMPVKSVSRRRLKYLLLLATRVAIILLIALAFARPYFPSLAGAFARTGKGRHLVVLLDNSLSMQYGDRWQRALRAAQDAVSAIGEQDTGQLVTFSSDYEIHNLAASDKAALKAVVDRGSSPTASTTSYAQAFRAVDRIAGETSKPLSVVMISDLQKSGMDNLQQGFPGGVVSDFKLVDVADDDAPNWVVSGARSHRMIYRGRYPDRLLVEVKGFSTPEGSKELTLSIAGKTVDRKTIQIPASGNATAVFASFDVPLGSNRGEVTISPGDGLPQDDTFHFVLERRNPYRVAFVHEAGDTRELYYFRSALAAETDSPFAIEPRTPSELGSANLRDYAMIIVSNTVSMPAAMVSDMKHFVEEGGGLLVTMGNRFPSPNMEGQWQDVIPEKGAEKRLLTRDGDRMVVLGQFEKEHPIFEEFREPGSVDSLRAGEFYGYIRVQPQGTVLMRFSNGDPALIEKKYGQGRVLLFTSTFDNVWTDFPLHPAFVPIAHQMIRYATQLSDQPPAQTIPSAASLNSFKSGQPGAESMWDVIGPDGKREVPLEQGRRPDFLTFRQPGFYEVRKPGSSLLLAANPDPRESDLKHMPAEDRALWTAGATGRTETEGGTEADAANRQSIWWNLLVLAFILAGVEAYLANQYLRVRSGTDPSETAKEGAYAG